jgi:hypothetical protein
MTVRQADGVIILEGDCGVEEAETLLSALLTAPGAEIDWSACGALHTAIFQLILASEAPIRGNCGDPSLGRWVNPLVRRRT